MLGTVLIDIMRSIVSGKRREVESAARPSRVVAPQSPAVFEPRDMQTAKSIILTAAPDITTEERWEIETRNTLAELERLFRLDASSVVLDYGCGAGRMAKALVDAHSCQVIGVDTSRAMRELAVSHVGSDRFVACDPGTLDKRIAAGLKTSHACCLWVLQHCAAPEEDIARIDAALDRDGELFVLNSRYRWLPTETGWRSDGVSVEALLADRFDVVGRTDVRNLVGSAAIANESYAIVLRKRGAAKGPTR